MNQSDTTVQSGKTSGMTFAKHVGQRLRQRRLERNMTQRDIYRSCGISIAFLSDVENGKRSISFSKLYGLAKVLGVSTDWFAKDWKG